MPILIYVYFCGQNKNKFLQNFKTSHWCHWWLTKWVSASHHLLLCCPLWRFLGLQKWWRQSPTFFTITFLAKTKTHKCLKLHYSPLHCKNINFTVLFYRTFWNTIQKSFVTWKLFYRIFLAPQLSDYYFLQDFYSIRFIITCIISSHVVTLNSSICFPISSSRLSTSFMRREKGGLGNFYMEKMWINTILFEPHWTQTTVTDTHPEQRERVQRWDPGWTPQRHNLIETGLQLL